MALVVTDMLFEQPDATHPLRRSHILVAATARPVFAKVGTVLRDITAPFRVFTDDNGTLTLSLPWPSESDPTTVQWTITLPDGTIISGPVPEGVSGPITIEALRGYPNWGVISMPLSPVTTVQGPTGPAGPQQFSSYTDSNRPASPTQWTPIVNTSEGGALQIWDGAKWLNSRGQRSYRDAVMALSPWAFWECLEQSGLTLNDSSGNGRQGTLPADMSTALGLSLIYSSPNKGAIQALNGNIVSNNSFPFGTDWSIEWMMEVTSLASQTILSTTDTTLTLNASGAMIINPGAITIAPNSTFAVNSKYHVVLTRTAGTFTMYVNGKQVGSFLAGSDPAASVATFAATATTPFSRSNFAFYTFALTQAQASAHFIATGNWASSFVPHS